MDPNVEQLILEGATSSRLNEAARQAGMRLLHEVAKEVVEEGRTTIEEVHRVLGGRAMVSPAGREDEVATVESGSQDSTERLDVLVVDDDGSNRMVARTLLEKEGFRVSEASDGADALVMLRKKSTYGLIVLDLDMPRVGGLEVLKQVRSSLATAGIPVIILTGTTDHGAEVKLMNAGADDYIRKPLEPPKFLARVRATLRRAIG